MNRSIIFAIGSLVFLQPGSAYAQDRIEAIVIPTQGQPLRVWITASTREGIRYFSTATTTTTSDMAVSQTKSIFFPDPPAFSNAMGLFRSRDYRAALDAFGKVAAEFQAVRPLANNPASRAAYFEMECHRLLGEYDKLAAKLGEFNSSGISRENELRQLELNLMWEALGSKAWDRLEALVRERAASMIPGDQRAQVAYCAGMVHEQKGEFQEALNSFNEAMIIDAAASEVVARMAALGILRILHADADVAAAREAWGTSKERPNSPGYAKLIEAGAVARMFEEFIGAGSPLPKDYQPYLQYKAPDPVP